MRGYDPLSASIRPFEPPTGRSRRRHVKPTSALQTSAAAETVPVLYIHPAKQGPDFRADTNLGRSYGLFPVGLPALVNLLRANGITVRGLVHPMEMSLNPAFQLEAWLNDHRQARVILIDMHWYEHCYGAVETARFCKRVLPHVKIIMGGLSASGFAGEILENFPAVDYIIRGDAEHPLLALVKLLLRPGALDQAALAEISNLSYRQDGQLVETPLSYCAAPEDLDQLNFVDIDFIEHAREYYVHEYIVTNLAQAREALQTSPYTGRWLTTARGCKHGCSYCGGSRLSHKKLAGRNGLVVRSPERIVDDLERLSDLGVIQASMAYDIADMGEPYWSALFAELRRRKVNIGIYNEFFQMPEREFVDAFAAHTDPQHSCLALSPLSGNERVRHLNGKQYNNQAFFDLLEVLSHHRIYLFVYFSINLPGETRETFEETLDFAHAIYDFYPHSLLKMLNTVHTLDPLSPMNIYAGKFGIRANLSTFMDYYAYCRDTGTQDPAARGGLRRGFDMPGREETGMLDWMVREWDRARLGREVSWWPVPPGW